MTLQKPFECITCDPGYEWGMRQEFTRPEGSGANGVLCIGESAGFFEARDGLPFRPQAPAGSVLERAFRRLGYNRESFRIANLIQCRPPGDKLDHQSYETAVITKCAVHRDRIVKEMQPKCILALGGLPLKWLTGFAGKFQTIHYMRGYILDGTMYPGVAVVPTFHPSFLRQGAMHLFGVLCHDIKLAVEVSRSGVPNRIVPTYATEPTEDEVEAFYQRLVDDPSRLVAYDIETPTSAHLSEDERDSDPSYQIVQVQFSDAPNTGIALPWTDPFIGWAKRILALPNPKVGHNNWNHDDPRLRAAGSVINGRVDDTMWVFHHLQPDLPAHLQFVGSFYGMQAPWKHRSEENLAWYGCADVDACQHILPKAMEDLRRRGLLEGYERHMRSLQPILQAMGDRGIPINSEARQEFQDAMKAEEDTLFDQVQQYVPEECRNVHPKQGYKRVPADTTGLIRRSFPVTVDIASGESVVTVDQTEERWCRLEPFNPGSWQQLIRYMCFRNHPVPRHFKTGDETTEARELRRLEKKTADPLYKVVLDYRAFCKMRSTYAEGWTGRNGRVHSLFTFSPAIGQIASRNPNVQNAPRQGELAKKFRRVVEATPGHRLVEFDWRSFFVLTMGFEAQDPDYCVAPETKLLTTDLEWKPAGKIQIGDELIGFDRSCRLNRQGTPIHRQALMPSHVDSVARLKRPCVVVYTDKVAVTCSVEHLWFARFSQRGHYRWMRADELHPDMQIAYAVRPWEAESSWEAGWMSGLLDGEGSVASHRGGLAVSQNPGIVLEEIKRILLSRSFQFTNHASPSGCVHLHIGGEQLSWMRALGIFRPYRLVAKAGTGWIGLVPFSKHYSPATVVKVEVVGEQEVCAIGTSTGTFIAEGLLSHNCRMARLDMHSFVTAIVAKEASAERMFAKSDDELRDYLAWVKSRYQTLRDDKVKHATLGYGNGLGARGMYQRYMENFESEAECKRLIATMNALFPRTALWRERVRHEAQDKGHLTTRFWSERQFFDVLVYWDKWKVKSMVEKGRRLSICKLCGRGHDNGEQAEQAVAYRPANDAFGMKKEVMLALQDQGLLERYRLINEVHDALLFECPDSLVDQCIPDVKREMERSSKVLVDPVVASDGLWCEVTVKTGKDWSRMEEVRC